jgi:hypothetical protein
MIVDRIDHTGVKHGFTTHAVPVEVMARVRELERTPQAGDLILAEVLTLGHHKKLEQRNGTLWHIFPGDLIIGAFGNRYATDQYEAYVPSQLVTECDLVSVGGVCGLVVARHPSMDHPTRLKIIGGVCDAQDRPINLRAFGLKSGVAPRAGKREVILVVGSSMNAGKTTTVGTLARALKQEGFRVAAAKVTGTAAGKDGRYFLSCGARPVLDFTFAGYPSTYMASIEDLLEIHRTLIAHLGATNPDFIILEVADGIFQRETRMLLENAEFRQSVDHVFFAANDSLSADCGARCLKSYGLPLRAIAGAFTQSCLAIREAEASTGIRCLDIEQMLLGGVLEVMGIERRQPVARAAWTIPEPVDLEESEKAVRANGNGNGAVEHPAVVMAQ